MIIHLIACPRTISTGMMYAFAQRSDTTVVDEPFYGLYLRHTHADHPAREEVIASQPGTEDDIIGQLHQKATEGHLFIKNIASHFKALDPARYEDMRTVFLIRDPRQIITSYAKVIEWPTQDDIGLQRQWSLYRHYSQRSHEPPIVIDSNDLLSDPKAHLERLCHELGLPFEEGMMSWPAGPKPYEGVWGLHWYGNLHRTTTFEKQRSSDDPFPIQHEALYQAARQHYRFLYNLRLQTDSDAPAV